MSQNKITSYFTKTPERPEAGMTSPNIVKTPQDMGSPDLSKNISSVQKSDKPKPIKKTSPNSKKPEKSEKPLDKSSNKTPLKSQSPNNNIKNVSSANKVKSTPKSTPKPSSIKPMETDENTPKRSPLSKDLMLPTHRIKMIMKSCPDVETVPHESLFLITRATEFFIGYLAEKSLAKSSSPAKLDYEALSEVVHNYDYLDFLKETIPKKMTWAECQKLMEEKNSQMDEIF